MRYPTSETAAKIEGYPAEVIFKNPNGEEVPFYDALASGTHDPEISKLEK